MFEILSPQDENSSPTQPRRVLMMTRHIDETSLLRLKRQITELLARKYQISLICPKDRRQENPVIFPEDVYLYQYPSINAETVFSKPLASLWHYICQFALTFWVVIGEGFDAIHAVNPPDSVCTIGGLFKFFIDTKVMLDCRTLSPELHESHHKSRGINYWLLRLIEKMAFSTADIVIVPNQSYRTVAMTRGKKSIDQVFIVGDSPDLEKSVFQLPDFGLMEGKKHLVCCSSIIDRPDGIPYLVEAMRHIVHDFKRTDIQFAVAGNENRLRFFEESAAKKQVNDHVSIAAPTVLSAADICVCPNEVNPSNDKTTTRQIIDYMSLGKPIVQFETTEGRFTAGNASLYAAANDARDLANKIVELIDNPQQRAAMGAFGRTRVERVLAWSYEAPRFRAAYDALFALIKEERD